MEEKIIKNNIKYLLEIKGKTAAWLSREVGITRAHMSSIVIQRANPSLYVAFRIAEVLEVELSDLFEPVHTKKPRVSKFQNRYERILKILEDRDVSIKDIASSLKVSMKNVKDTFLGETGPSVELLEYAKNSIPELYAELS